MSLSNTNQTTINGQLEISVKHIPDLLNLYDPLVLTWFHITILGDRLTNLSIFPCWYVKVAILYGKRDSLPSFPSDIFDVDTIALRTIRIRHYSYKSMSAAYSLILLLQATNMGCEQAMVFDRQDLDTNMAFTRNVLCTNPINTVHLIIHW